MNDKPPEDEDGLVHYYAGPQFVGIANGGRAICGRHGLVTSYNRKVTCPICVRQLLSRTLRTKRINNT